MNTPRDFDKATRGLKKARIESYKGFVFVSLDVDGSDSLQDYLGDAKVFFDMMVAQSADWRVGSAARQVVLYL